MNLHLRLSNLRPFSVWARLLKSKGGGGENYSIIRISKRQNLIQFRVSDFRYIWYTWNLYHYHQRFLCFLRWVSIVRIVIVRRRLRYSKTKGNHDNSPIYWIVPWRVRMIFGVDNIFFFVSLSKIIYVCHWLDYRWTIPLISSWTMQTLLYIEFFLAFVFLWFSRFRILRWTRGQRRKAFISEMDMMCR